MASAKMLVQRKRHYSDVTDTDDISFVFGSVNGQLRAAFSKLATLNAKNGFSFAIVTGNLFGNGQDDDQLTDLLEGRIEIPCPTYFTVGTTPLPRRVLEKVVRDEEVAPNLHYLGRRSITKTSEGVRIVTLGGVLADTVEDQHGPFHTDAEAKSLKGANNADILLTTLWPADVWKNSAKARELQIDSNTAPSSQSIAELCEALKPRYHFAMSPADFAFEREPFFPETAEDKDKGISLTRFISLAPWANAAKAKSMYAFVLNRETIINPPAGSTLTPFYKPASKRQANNDSGFSRFDRSGENRDDYDHRRRKRRRERSPPPGPDRCFFCLSNPNLPTHMVCSIGDDSYLATARGPLPAADTFKNQGLDFPGHFIITPLTHAATLGEAEFREMKRFRDALQNMVASASKRQLGAVTWEISREKNIHIHWQFMPVPAEMVSKGLVEAGFRVLAEDMKLGKLTQKEFGTADEVKTDYFRVWIWAEEDTDDGRKVACKSLFMPLDESIRFDLQYPRKVMAKLLGLENRTFWQDVVQTEEEETSDVSKFREVFKEWDFTLAS